jgi:uracil-DNA glycosylase
VTLQIDARRLAMLREMGLRLLPPFQAPHQEDPVVPAAVETAAAGPVLAPIQPPASARVEPAPTGPSSGDLMALGWDELEAAARALAGEGGAAQAAVFGVGPRRADWMVIGDAPGDDAQGPSSEPFTGQAATLLDNMLRAIGLERARDAYTTTLLKCRPPGGRNPEPHELGQWEPLLRRQVALLQPRVLLVMGRFAAQTLLQTPEPIGRLRGRVHRYQGVQVVVTYPPAYLLRNLPDKAKVWADLCLAQDLLSGVQDPASGR